MKQTPQTLKGFRDFLPAEKRARDYVANTIVSTFNRFGFAPIETPTLEYASLLMGKYGDEADKLLYTFEDKGKRLVGLRYDQTVPTARVLSQYAHELPRYFRRYQMQHVFRADKPQKGRYREFAQCDIDIFGSTDPMADAEIIACTYASFRAIGFEQITLLLNDRKTLLSNLESFATEAVNVFSIIQSIDKLDKQSGEAVTAELVRKGLTPEMSARALDSIMKAAPSEWLLEVQALATDLGVPTSSLQFTPTLARGLDYYTGTIFEVTMPIEDFNVGSFGGGGRYDNLISDLGGQATPAVGIAFGFDRIVQAAEALHLIPSDLLTTQVLMTLIDDNTTQSCLALATTLRQAGISVMIYSQRGDKLGKQLKYASDLGIKQVLILGSDELEAGHVTIKNMALGDQTQIPLEQVVDHILGS